MKRIPASIAILVFSFTAGVLFPKDVRMDPFFVHSPRIMAQGGSFTAAASGHEALFTNPAGFYSKKGSLTIPALTGWAFMDPETISSGNYGFMESQADNGFGGGASFGISFVGRGLGLGFIGTTNLLMQGDPFPSGVDGTFSTTFALVGGYARRFQIGSTRLILGGDLRPMIRGYADISEDTYGSALDAYFDDTGNKKAGVSDDDLYAALNDPDADGRPRSFAFQGAGLGIDLGAKWEIGHATLGLSVRDLFNTRFDMFGHPLGDYVGYLRDNYSLPSNSDAEDTSDTYYMPMEFNFGAAYHLDLGRTAFFLDPTLHFELVDPFDLNFDGGSFWSRFRLGAELLSLRFVRLQAGLNQGYASIGAGFKLFFLDVSCALFNKDVGLVDGPRASTGVSFEAALRF